MKKRGADMNWKKAIAIGALAMGAMGLLAGCGGDQKSASASQAASSSHKIVIGLDDNFPPFGFKDKDGNLTGFDIDLAKEAGKRMGDDIEFKQIDWASKEAELKSHKIDAIWSGLSMLPERQKVMLFSRPYENARQIILVKEDSPIQSKADLAGKVVATQEGSTGLDAINADAETKAGFKELKLYPDNVSAFMDLKIGRIDAMIVSEVVALYYNKQNNAGFRVVDGGYDQIPVGVGIAQDNEAFKKRLDKTLEEMKADGTSGKISEKWFGKDITL